MKLEAELKAAREEIAVLRAEIEDILSKLNGGA
jgi:hypothetical protein